MEMMFNKKPETIKFGDFMSGEYKHKGKGRKTPHGPISNDLGTVLKWGTVIPIVGHLTTKGTLAMASTGETVTIPAGEAVTTMASGAVMEKIAHAFDPLIDLMVGISLPIAGVMLTGGALMIMIGQKELGYRLIMNCSLGYVLVQMSPLFIDLLAGVGSAI
jgi:hypothetical protein